MEFQLNKAELARKRYLYKRLIQRGKLTLPPKDAQPLVGPDCAYHLYSQIGAPRKKPTARHAPATPQK